MRTVALLLLLFLVCSVHTFRLPLSSRSLLPFPVKTSLYRLLDSTASSSSSSSCSPPDSPDYDALLDVYADNFQLNQRWGGAVIGPVVRYINDFIVGVLYTYILRIINKFIPIRKETLIRNVMHRDTAQGLLTVSNHQSFFDDPGLWAAILPFWLVRPERLRWTLIAHDIFFRDKRRRDVLACGNCMPIKRKGGSLDQKAFQNFHTRLNNGAWCHIYPEGRIWQDWRFKESEQKLGVMKIGVGKLIAHCDTVPIVIPMYHKGMDAVIPESCLSPDQIKEPSSPISFTPVHGNTIECYIGHPLDFSKKIKDFNALHPGALSSWATDSKEKLNLYADITIEVRESMLSLEAEARACKTEPKTEPKAETTAETLISENCLPVKDQSAGAYPVMGSII